MVKQSTPISEIKKLTGETGLVIIDRVGIDALGELPQGLECLYPKG
ncbi:MAG: hypothetical protein LBC51_04055 [Treponema sp.]|jgi:hypothetical protein|nr:hypothetical protein [Treponema sp.]